MVTDEVVEDGVDEEGEAGVEKGPKASVDEETQ